MAGAQEPRSSWTFLTQHARVLLMVARDADVRLRDVAVAGGMTERAVRAIVSDLENAGCPHPPRPPQPLPRILCPYDVTALPISVVADAYSTGQLAQVRHHAEAWARSTALTPARQGDLLLAISEATANSLAHGDGSGTLRLWTGRTQR
ncbi:hypothetical protein BG452_15190 [Streptomyces sp. CBMA123]|nr:hypothetical protein [Streptomyces sp. CBMA123]